MSTQRVMDAWLDAIEGEFGLGWHTATLARLHPTVVDLLERPDAFASSIVEFGYEHGAASHDLDFGMRCLELLGTVTDQRFADRLDARDVAVLLAEGWNAGTIARLRPTDDLLTPMPVFLHLLQQRYAGAAAQQQRVSSRVVLVVVDLRDLVATRPELERVRAATIATIRSIWSAAHPISEGINGNLAVMVERTDATHAQAGRLRQLILSDESVHADRIRIWIEPLSDASIHVVSHLEGLVGAIEPLPEQKAFRGSLVTPLHV